MIGKGERAEEARRAIQQAGAVYLCAIGGAGALYAGKIVCSEVIAFSELGCESVRRMTVRDFPVLVGCDCVGGNIFAR